MAPKQDAPSKSLVNKDGGITKLTEWATQDVNSVDEMMALFEDQGVEYSHGEELTADFVLITADEKQLFMKKVQGQRLFCARWEFHSGDKGEFVAVHAVFDPPLGKYIFNDGSKAGVKGQLADITQNRIQKGQSLDRATSGLLVPRGLVPNKPFYYLDCAGREAELREILLSGDADVTVEQADAIIARHGRAINRADLEIIPEGFKKLAKPTWKFEF